MPSLRCRWVPSFCHDAINLCRSTKQPSLGSGRGHRNDVVRDAMLAGKFSLARFRWGRILGRCNVYLRATCRESTRNCSLLVLVNSPRRTFVFSAPAVVAVVCALFQRNYVVMASGNHPILMDW